MSLSVTLRRPTYAGLFMVTLATLMYEILLTRIFSVTMWYHFAFVAISVALFGMTVGAMIVFLRPRAFTPERVSTHLTLSALGFAVSIVFSFLTYLSIPFVPQISLVGLYSIVLIYAVISLPFVFSGVCVSLALTKFPPHISTLYAFDLAGAAAGCVLLIYTLRLTDGPTAVLIVAGLAGIGGALFALETANLRLRWAAVACGLILTTLAAGHAWLAAHQRPLLRPLWVKGRLESRPLYEKWNPFSRIQVRGDPRREVTPFGWGLSDAYPRERTVRQLQLDIDASASTPLTAFDGDRARVEHLKYDVTNLAHYIRQGARVLIIGTGGGRDVLSALVFGQRSVVAVEINGDILDAANQVFGDFTGHLDQDPRVRFVKDEARSYIARLPERFDIIQASLVDSWAATAAGAFVLAENSLYTVEAWTTFLQRLTPNGVLTFSRWYSRDRPDEMYRMTSLAVAALARLGVTDPRGHIVVIRHLLRGEAGDRPEGVGTILVSRAPFSDGDLDTLEGVARRMHFDAILTPRAAGDAVYAGLAWGPGAERVIATFPLNIAAPTDDSPFFFQMLRPRDVIRVQLWRQPGPNKQNLTAVFVLEALMFTVIALTMACIIVPVALTTRRSLVSGTASFSLFFLSIGLGFMLVEISQMQRLIMFLGHPTYALSVVLFVLLLSSGLGSYTTGRVAEHGIVRSGLWRLGLLIGVLAVFGALTPWVVRSFQAVETSNRILIAALILAPLGFFLGMVFPTGMRLATRQVPALAPWLWGLNGATSVCGSVLAVVIALTWGISAAFWTGVGAYLLALAAFLQAGRSTQRARLEIRTMGRS